MLYIELEPSLLRLTEAGNLEARRELIEGFWDRQILRKYGLPKISSLGSSLPGPSPKLAGLQNILTSEPDPQPNIAYRLDLYDHILSGLIKAAAGDPDAEPSIVGALIDPRARLTSAKQLIPRLNKAIDGIGKEIELLEKRLGNR